MNKNNSEGSNSTEKHRFFSRRRFFQVGAILVGGTAATIYFGQTSARRYLHQMITEIEPLHNISNLRPDLVFEIQEDNSLLINMVKAEMGQGIFTGLAMLVVEEFDISMDQVRIIPSPPAAGMIDGGTGGSFTTASLYVVIRELAATFREMLKIAAAKQWSMNVSQLDTKDGIISAGDNRTRYVDIVNATGEWEIPDTPPPLRPTSSFRVVGTEQPRIDLNPKVMGEPIFAIDNELPEMLYANVLKCPYISATLKHVDVAAAKTVAGVVEVIQDDDFVAVVAENQYAAERGKHALSPEWQVNKIWQQAELDQMCTVGASSPVNLQRDGNAGSIFKQDSGKLLAVEYRVAMGAHAQMEPQAAIADVQSDKTSIFTSTQNAATVQATVAEAINIEPEKVEVHNSFLGGSFGRRIWLGPAVDAARLSMAMGRPVKVVWDRETEFLSGFVRPSTHHTLQAKINNAGKMTAIEHNIASGFQIYSTVWQMLPDYVPLRAVFGADISAASHGSTIDYNVENRETNIWDVTLPYNAGIWRGVGMFQNSFAIESFIDEVAHAAGQDPFEFRLAHLSGDEEKVFRMRQVLIRLRKESHWDNTKENGTGRGLAIVEDRRTIAAAVIEVRKEAGNLRVIKVTSAIDPGVAINPDGIRQQVEGCIMMGISAALYEEVTVQDGQFTSTNYHQYQMAMLSDTPPEINVVILEGSETPSGAGEPPLGPIAPAIANALFDLTGQRVRKLPLLKEMG